MQNSLNFRDLLLRIFVIAITSLVITLITRSNQFDLHFKLRKAQKTSEHVQIIEINDQSQLENVINKLLDRKVKHIFASEPLRKNYENRFSQYLVNEANPQALALKIQPNTDGILRRTAILHQPFPLIEPNRLEEVQTINFRGPAGSFDRINFYEISESNIDLAGKIVIIDTRSNEKEFTTPVGLLPESEVIATLVDNAIEGRFIPEANLSIQYTVLATILLLTIVILLYLPSTLAMLSTFVFAIFYTSLSLWVFDNFYIWTPLVTPVIQMVLTLLLISNYKFVLNEKTKWKLEKESLFFEEVEEMKTNFLSLFSHDLKTPLAKIIGIADTLTSKATDPEIRGELEKINLASRDLEKYIKRILKMSQIQSKNISLNKSPSDINNLIEKAIEQNQLSANEKNIKIVKDLKPLFMIEIDGALVQEVIINFIENAITYSPENTEIKIKSEENKDFIKVSVEDQGQGIPKKAQESIWEKYYRNDSQSTGYGLGLFLSRYVIQLHDGRVFLKSKENAGSEFGFVLPINQE